jgi:hypothetical protein
VPVVLALLSLRRRTSMKEARARQGELLLLVGGVLEQRMDSTTLMVPGSLTMARGKGLRAMIEGNRR